MLGVKAACQTFNLVGVGSIPTVPNSDNFGMCIMYNHIILGDCLDVMGNMPDKSMDMILSDPPYAITSRNEWDTIIPFESMWEHFERISKDNAAMVFTAAQPFASKLVMSNLKLFRYDIVWIKNNSTGFLNAKKMPLRKHELILVFYKKLPIYNPQKTLGHRPINSYTKRKDNSTNYGEVQQGIGGGGQTDRYPTSVLNFPVINNYSNERLHPTQKPVSLFEWLIKTYTNEGMTVLDNCIGSGTTAIACINTNRTYVGIEKHRLYYEVAIERIKSMNGKSKDIFG